MTDNIITKPLGLVLIITAHMVFNGPSQAKVTGILGRNITLQFTFNDTDIHNHSKFAIYITGEKKIDQYSGGKPGPGGGIFSIFPKNASVFYHITNLTRNQSETYWATLFVGSGLRESNTVELIVLEENTSSTVPPMPANITIIKDSGSSSFLSYQLVTVLVVLPVVLLAAVLPWSIWCLVRTKDEQHQPQQNSNPTVQETFEDMPPPSLVYSVLDFPRRPPVVLDINPNDTEYAAVSYLSEKRLTQN
uniref:uncharacterized protein LOC109966851 n=1 Tax=Monopterus albus TaxID=43700 RepID=UPI0009B3A180|nr:uncharacterized protein LOC109966851 [Monopterus albus]